MNSSQFFLGKSPKSTGNPHKNLYDLASRHIKIYGQCEQRVK